MTVKEYLEDAIKSLQGPLDDPFQQGYFIALNNVLRFINATESK